MHVWALYIAGEHKVSTVQQQGSGLTKYWIAIGSTYCYLLFPSLHVLMDPVVFGHYFVQRKLFRSSSKTTCCNNKVWEQQILENNECTMKMRQIFVGEHQEGVTRQIKAFSCVLWEGWQIQWCSSESQKAPALPIPLTQKQSTHPLTDSDNCQLHTHKAVCYRLYWLEEFNVLVCSFRNTFFLPPRRKGEKLTRRNPDCWWI